MSDPHNTTETVTNALARQYRPPRSMYLDYQEIDMTGRRGGVWVRRIVEFIDDASCCMQIGDHANCLESRTAARWPDPNPGQGIDE